VVEAESLRGAALGLACLVPADLAHTDMRGADLRRANLRGARRFNAKIGALPTWPGPAQERLLTPGELDDRKENALDGSLALVG
jgi:pentapeptide repeat protein